MRPQAAFREIRGQLGGEGEPRLAQGIVHDGDRGQQDRRAYPRAERLGERLLGGKTLGKVASLVRRLQQSGPFLGRQQTAGRRRAVPRPDPVETLDRDEIGPDAVDHAAGSPRSAASRINCFISRTASRRPTKTARLTMA